MTIRNLLALTFTVLGAVSTSYAQKTEISREEFTQARQEIEVLLPKIQEHFYQQYRTIEAKGLDSIDLAAGADFLAYSFWIKQELRKPTIEQILAMSVDSKITYASVKGAVKTWSHLAYGVPLKRLELEARELLHLSDEALKHFAPDQATALITFRNMIASQKDRPVQAKLTMLSTKNICEMSKNHQGNKYRNCEIPRFVARVQLFSDLVEHLQENQILPEVEQTLTKEGQVLYVFVRENGSLKLEESIRVGTDREEAPIFLISILAFSGL